MTEEDTQLALLKEQLSNEAKMRADLEKRVGILEAERKSLMIGTVLLLGAAVLGMGSYIWSMKT